LKNIINFEIIKVVQLLELSLYE